MHNYPSLSDSFALLIDFPADNYMFQVNNRNSRTKVWNMFKVNNKDYII